MCFEIDMSNGWERLENGDIEVKGMRPYIW